MAAEGPEPRLDAPGPVTVPESPRADALPSPAPEPEDREIAILRELAREAEARVAFQGLRRKLDLHQQALARSLRRLERQGLVARDERGYALTEDGFAALAGRAAPRPRRDVLSLVTAVLPPHLHPDVVAGALSRRWFRGLRWYGQSEAPGETTLAWISEPGHSTVRVRMTGGTASLEVERASGDDRAYESAGAVLAALGDLYALSRPGPRDEDFMPLASWDAGVAA